MRNSGKERRKKHGRLWVTSALLAAAAASLFLVVFFGWYQFSNRASRPIDEIRNHAIPGTDETVGEGIQAFIQDKGVEIVREGFEPSWGAEETADDVFTVSYVYEVGREANWISWRVELSGGKVTPLDSWARELWEGSGQSRTASPGNG